MDVNIQEEIEKFISTAWEQITNESSTVSVGTVAETEFYFTQQFFHSATDHGLTEEDALEVYHTGEPSGEGKIVRLYPDYEIGITYFFDSHSARPVITSIWKQEIR